MDSEQMRAEFEEWARSTFNWHTWEQVAPEEPKTISSWDGEKYGHRVVNGMWLAWQGSRAALVVELPPLNNSHLGGPDSEYGPSIEQVEDMGFDYGIKACREIINAAGITVKEGV